MAANLIAIDLLNKGPWAFFLCFLETPLIDFILCHLKLYSAVIGWVFVREKNESINCLNKSTKLRPRPLILEMAFLGPTQSNV